MKRKLLLADDSTTIRRVIELTFSSEDVEVVSVEDGEQAIQRIPLEEPDIVLADIGIPKRNGYDVAEFVKGHPDLAHVPVLLMTGAFEPIDETRARQVKAAGVVVKPFEPHLLVARVRELVDTSASFAPHAEEPSRERSARQSSRPGAGGRIDPAAASGGPPVPGPASPASEIGAARTESATSLDDYFDRLDAAFQTLGTSQPPRPPAPRANDDGFDADVPTIDDVLGPASTPSRVETPPPGRVAPPTQEPADSPSTLAASTARRLPVPARHGTALADLFGLLLAVEQGEANASSLRIDVPQPTAITDELVDAVTRRVLDRLAPDALHGMVERIVRETAERLVQQEIDRIRKG